MVICGNMHKKFLIILYFTSAALTLNSCKEEPTTPVTNPEPDNWRLQSTGITNNLKCIFFIDALTGFAVGNSYPADSNKIIKTTDGGINWLNKQTSVPSSS